MEKVYCFMLVAGLTFIHVMIYTQKHTDALFKAAWTQAVYINLGQELQK